MKKLALLLILSPFICSSFSIAESPPFRIGVLLPLTGNFAYFGEQTKQGLTLALEELNASLKRKIELVYEDDECLPKMAVRGMTKLLEIDKVDLVIGPACSTSILSVAPLVQRKNTPVVFLLDTGEQVAALPDPLFSIGFSPNNLARLLATNMISKGFKKIATITEEEEYAILISKAFTERYKSLGGIILTALDHPTSSKDYRTTTLNALKNKPDAIFMSSAYETGTFLKQLRTLNKTIPVFGNDTMCVQETIDTAGAAAENGVCANVMLDESHPKVKEFRALLVKKFGAVPNSLFYSALGYDGLKTGTVILEKSTAYARNNIISGTILSAQKLSAEGVVPVTPNIAVIKGGKLVSE